MFYAKSTGVEPLEVQGFMTLISSTYAQDKPVAIFSHWDENVEYKAMTKAEYRAMTKSFY